MRTLPSCSTPSTNTPRRIAFVANESVPLLDTAGGDARSSPSSTSARCWSLKSTRWGCALYLPTQPLLVAIEAERVVMQAEQRGQRRAVRRSSMNRTAWTPPTTLKTTSVGRHALPCRWRTCPRAGPTPDGPRFVRLRRAHR